MSAKPEKYVDPKDSVPPRVDTYANWQKEQGIPVVRGFFVEDINTLDVKPWSLKEANGCFVHLDGCGQVNDAYVLELPPGAKTSPQKHMYEELVYVTKGHGATTVWQDGGRKHTFEWGEGSVFAIPLNANYQHFNTSGSPTRYYAMTNASFMMNLFHNQEYIFNNPFVFDDRFSREAEDYFKGEGEVFGRFFMTTNFIPDIRTVGLRDYSERGKGSSNMKFDLAKSTMTAHVSEFPVGTYKKAHRHGPGAHVIILSGQGYSTLWRDEEDKQQTVHWKPGSVVVPPDKWFHQHFNSGATPARYLAFRWNSWRFKSVMRTEEDNYTYTSVKKGGAQIEFEDEDPAVHANFVSLIGKAGASCNMCEYYPHCSKKMAAAE
jgi:oxalate decarboxylase/phosphoglucose isomerase-like protein (cupin superfamily)